ncbi:hypothetical protein [Halalkalibacterium ligniniphilum]|uniref:hypothetical protein n=1 Tax=Halalkalibacterium ligniniphilum TaxID=1134413 RepID=UPI000347FED0|nr:hypothetical protein [Halalkalibacterium ligniniphilum]
MTLAFSLARSAPAARIRYPEEEIMTGTRSKGAGTKEFLLMRHPNVMIVDV